MAIYNPESNQHSDGRDSEASFYPKDKSTSLESEFIPYAEALEMKKLGYDIPTRDYYRSTGSGPFFYKEALNWNDDKRHETAGGMTYVSAPLWQQSFRWFSKNYQLSGAVNDRLLITGEVEAYWRILINRYNSEIKSHANFAKTYEEAQLACLQKLIKIVKDETTR